MLAWFDARIEAALPAPLIGVDRHAGAPGDRADLDVALEDAPAVAVRALVAAAGEGGQAWLLERYRPFLPF